MFKKKKQDIGNDIYLYQGQGKLKEVWRRLRKNRGAMIGLIMLGGMTVILLGAPIFVPYDLAITQNSSMMLAAPSAAPYF